MRLWNYWNVSYGGDHNFEFLDDLDTRDGGPPIIKPARDFHSFNVNTDSRKRWGLGFLRLRQSRRARRLGSETSDTTSGFSRQAGFRRTSALTTRVPTTAAQWIENTDADGDGIDDHVYGRLKRNVVNITGRGTYAFSRDMTLEVFLQPFVAVGDYYDIRKLAQPKSFLFTPVSLEDDPDFNRKSLRGNVVLRWEYLRGSTLFVVWNMATADESRPACSQPGAIWARRSGAGQSCVRGEAELLAELVGDSWGGAPPSPPPHLLRSNLRSERDAA